MLKSHNPYNVLSEVISFENVQQIGEMIALKTLRGRYAYARQTLEWLYVGYVKDLNRANDSHHVFSDAYDLAQTAICFLCEFIGKNLNDVYTVKNGKTITIKHATYMLVGRTIDRMRRYMSRSRDINDYTEELSVEIDHYEEKDYTEVDNKIELLNLMLKRVLPFIDIEKIKTASVNVLTNKFKDVCRGHHLHDLRHTFITRAQECGIRREIVSLWAGHKADSSLTTTVYTHFQERSELQITEIQKYDYEYNF